MKAGLFRRNIAAHEVMLTFANESEVDNSNAKVKNGKVGNNLIMSNRFFEVDEVDFSRNVSSSPTKKASAFESFENQLDYEKHNNDDNFTNQGKKKIELTQA